MGKSRDPGGLRRRLGSKRPLNKLWRVFLLNEILQLVGGFAGGYLYATLIESYFHEHISDATKETVERWKRHPRLLKQLIESNYSHHTIHHIKTYRVDHVTQFRSPEDQERIDRELNATPHGIAVREALYGSKFSPMGWVAFVAPLVPAVVALYAFVGVWAAIGAFIAISLPPILSNYVHPYLHMPYEEARAKAPWLLSMLLGTRYVRAVARHHFLHHRYINRNFNLLLGGDWLRGKVRRANARDLAEMRRIGIRVD